jgi:predicted  nucleic acid-binding Zn-ribbon protein
MTCSVTRNELLAQLDHIDAEINTLRGRRALTTYKLEQALKERDRLQRHLDALDREEA